MEPTVWTEIITGVTNAITITGDVVDLVVAHPILLVGTIFSVLGGAIVTFKRLA